MQKATQPQAKTKHPERVIIAIHLREELEVLYKSINEKNRNDSLETEAEPTKTTKMAKVDLR
jgi:hypothetical protein